MTNKLACRRRKAARLHIPIGYIYSDWLHLYGLEVTDLSGG